MAYDFNKIINRKNTNSSKYDFLEENGFSADTIPLWVADMDFASPPEITSRLGEVAAHGVYGYSDHKPGYYQAVRDWFLARHNINYRAEWLVKTPGVVFAVAMAVRALTREGDSVLIQQPVYYPFERVIRRNNRHTVNCPLVYENGRYDIDFDAFEKTLREQEIKLFILCSPHNPVGRVWTLAELTRMGELCLKYHVPVVADEIHCDFVFEGCKHIPFAGISEAFAQSCVVCTAPSKTFNLAGLQTANIFIPSEELRNRYKTEISAAGSGGIGIFGLAACEAAYRYGGDWLDQLLSYLQENLLFAKQFLGEHLPLARVIEPEGTYLLWVDLNSLDADSERLNQRIKSVARLWLDDGAMFGAQGKGFQRINIACPRAVLAEALERFCQALSQS